GKFLLPGAQGCPPFHEKERGAVSSPLADREMRGRLQSREGPARREWLQFGPSTGSILPFERRAGSHRAAGTCSSVSDQQCLTAVQALSGPRHGKTRIGSSAKSWLTALVQKQKLRVVNRPRVQRHGR